MEGRFRQFPSSIRELVRVVRLAPGAPDPSGAGLPALLIHPDWKTPAPAAIWLHGRTASKELDPGRYARWIKAGIGAIAIDLPGHGERIAQEGDLSRAPAHELMARVLPEIDRAVSSLAQGEWQGVFDTGRLAIGGMSLGGMCALRRLCDPHNFRCAAAEATSGNVRALYEFSRGGGSSRDPAVSDAIGLMNPVERLANFAPIPLLALHSEADRMVPWPIQQAFLERLRRHYRSSGADPDLVEVRTWPTTGAPEEHIGFGNVSNEAKNTQADFLARRLRTV